jgi:hypothetical protein
MQRFITRIRLYSLVAAGLGAAALTATAGLILASSTLQVEARPAFASQTGFPCTRCHTNPPQLTSYGRQFKENGNKVK